MLQLLGDVVSKPPDGGVPMDHPGKLPVYPESQTPYGWNAPPLVLWISIHPPPVNGFRFRSACEFYCNRVL